MQRSTSGVDELGQSVTTSWQTFETPKCLFLTTSGNQVVSVRNEFKGTMSFYLEAHSMIREGDRVVNIRDKDGIIIEPGPLEVISTKRVANHLSGKTHHISAKLVGVA